MAIFSGALTSEPAGSLLGPCPPHVLDVPNSYFIYEPTPYRKDSVPL